VRAIWNGLRHDILELFSSSYRVAKFLRGGFFLRKKPLGGYVSLYTNWRTAIVAGCILFDSIESQRGYMVLFGAAALPARADVREHGLGFLVVR
jgi:hypothetical protein